MSTYNDIVHLSRPISKRTPMPRANRAAQFAPFAALHGHEEAIDETARLTDRKIELEEEQKAIINEKLLYHAAHRDESLRLIYFCADPFKDGGCYAAVTGYIKKIDELARCVMMTDGTIIKIDDIISAG